MDTPSIIGNKAMPTYEYACSACDNHWEEVQRITAPSTEECPQCHQKTAHRQISAGNFILKGGGWYSDLYSSAKPAKAESSEGGSKSEAKGETKAESSGSKAEGKAETKSEKSEKKDSTAPAAASPSTTTSGSGGSTKD
jgi:putative FmdB family regulatory protein